MITSFETGAVFTLKDEATAILERLGLKFEELDKQLAGIQTRFGTIIPPEFKVSLGGAAEQLKAMGISADKVATGISASYTKLAESLGVKFEDIQKLGAASFSAFGDAGAAAADRIRRFPASAKNF